MKGASAYGYVEIAKYLVEKGADISKMTIVEWASAGWLEKVQECIENSADVSAKNKKGKTALRFASQNGHLDIVKYLVENGADINIKRSIELCVMKRY